METISQIEAGVIKFIDCEIAPKIPVHVPNGQLKKVVFLAGAAYAVHNGVKQYINHPVLSQLGAVDQDGSIDVDGILESAKRVIPETGFKATVPVLGDLIFYVEDLDRLASYIKET
ncbi:MAG: hypothetical protein K2O84_01895 [Oscillospiraceae bacterium]|nr:hypothetical protein [Oscillospiraceae bacterium]